MADASDRQPWLTPPEKTGADCKMVYKGNEHIFSTNVKDTQGEYPSLESHGFLGTGHKLYGPFLKFDGAVASGIDALEVSGPIGGLKSKGVTIFEGENGFYRSIPDGAGGYGGRGLVDDAGLFSNLEIAGSVVTITRGGNIGDHIGSPYVGVDPAEEDYQNLSTDDAEICY